MTPEHGPIRSIVVVGAGTVGLSAALAFARALPRSNVAVIATPPDPGALADRLPGTLPTTTDILDRLGVTEADLVRAGAATHRLGNRFAGWRADGAVWTHGFGETGARVGRGPFHQYWLDARRNRSRTPYHHFAPAAALGEAGRFVHPANDARSLLSRLDYALRLDPVEAPRLLAAKLAGHGVGMTPAADLAVIRDEGGVAGLQLGGDRRVVADLYVDCSGPAALLLGDGDWEDWGEVLPVDRLLLAVAANAAPAPLDDYKAIGIGWQAKWPLRDRTLVGLGFAQDTATEARARRLFGDAGVVAEAITVRPGRRRQPWRGNVLALGDAAVVTGPLGWTGLALAHAGLALALDLLPGRDLHSLVLAEYNRRATWRADRVRDFLALHYVGAALRGEFWQPLQRVTPPSALAEALATFARRGQLPLHEEETFDKQSWLAVLLGLDIVPAGRDPTVMATDPAEIDPVMTRLEAAVAALPASLPPYPDYLARMAAGR